MVANRLRDAAAVLEVDSAYRRDAAIMREAADEVDRLRHDIERHVEIACELATECERLRAELAACQQDAERYRWLRKQHWNTSKFAVVCDPKNSIKLGYDCPSLERLDDLIDSELLQAQT